MNNACSIEATRELCADLDNLIELTKEGRAPIRALSLIERAREDLQAYLDEIERTSSAPRALVELGLKAKREMTADLLPAVFTIEIGDTPAVTFEAQNLREARELCHEHWLKEDLAEARSNGVPLWDGKAKLRARRALPCETALFSEARDNDQPSDGLMFVYLVAVDGSTTDTPST